MTATLYTFLKTDGTEIEINSDRIDFMQPITYTLPAGVAVGTVITVDQIDIAVQNSLTAINSAIGLNSIVVPLSQPSGAIIVFPTVMGSSQNDPFRYINRREFFLWTESNSPDGMSGTFFLSKVLKYPPWLDPSSKANFGYSHTVQDLTPTIAPPIDQFQSQPFTALQYAQGLDALTPQRNYFDTSLPPAYGDFIGPNYNYADTNYYQPPPKIGFPSWG